MYLWLEKDFNQGEKQVHESQAKETTTTETKAKKANRAHRAYSFFALVKHRQIEAETNQPKPQEVLAFESKAAMRAKLEEPAYETAEVRVIRGYELNVKAKRNFSVN